MAELNLKNWSKAPVRLERISDLTLDWTLYPRNEVDHADVVSRYAKALDAGCEFPTIKVGLFQGKKIIVDGVHRIRAHELNEVEYIRCSILPFDDKAELFAEAIRLNSNHGRAFSKGEIRENVRKLKRFNFKREDIVLLTHIPATEIFREVKGPVTRVTGKNIYCNIKKVKCSGQPTTKELIEFKNALQLIRDVAQKGCIPTDDDYFKQLVKQCRIALKELRFTAKSGIAG